MVETGRREFLVAGMATLARVALPDISRTPQNQVTSKPKTVLYCFGIGGPTDNFKKLQEEAAEWNFNIIPADVPLVNRVGVREEFISSLLNQMSNLQKHFWLVASSIGAAGAMYTLQRKQLRMEDNSNKIEKMITYGMRNIFNRNVARGLGDIRESFYLPLDRTVDHLRILSGLNELVVTHGSSDTYIRRSHAYGLEKVFGPSQKFRLMMFGGEGHCDLTDNILLLKQILAA